MKAEKLIEGYVRVRKSGNVYYVASSYDWLQMKERRRTASPLADVTTIRTPVSPLRRRTIRRYDVPPAQEAPVQEQDPERMFYLAVRENDATWIIGTFPAADDEDANVRKIEQALDDDWFVIGAYRHNSLEPIMFHGSKETNALKKQALIHYADIARFYGRDAKRVADKLASAHVSDAEDVTA